MINNNQLYGNYVGLVIQNDDPEKRGRVKVFVPHINYRSYKGWTEIEADKFFNNLEDPDVSNILAELREVLPWAEVAGPLFGGNASGRYNGVKRRVYTSNSNRWLGDDLLQGNRPAASYTGAGNVHDGFNDAGKTGILNPYTFEYDPSDYSSLAAGMFTIPNVGAHVWIFFENGDHNCPVYWASSYSQSDYKRIYTTVKFTDKTLSTLGSDALNKAGVSVDYPSEYENSDLSVLTSEAKTFRAKHVINTNKNVIELIDTDNREMIKLTHFSGSFKEWNNYTTSEFAANNDQQLVMGDRFETVRKSKNTYVVGNNRLFIDGDNIKRVGDSTYDDVKNIGDILFKINEYKQLFDTCRVGRFIYQRTSGLQSLLDITGVNSLSPHQEQKPKFEGIKSYDGVQYNNGFVRCSICKNTPYSVNPTNWSLSYKAIPGEGNTMIYEPIMPEEIPLYKDLVALSSRTAFGDTPPGVGFYAGAKCDICNSDYLNIQLRRPGFSTSTEHGLFEYEEAKQRGGDMFTYYVSIRDNLNKLLASCAGGDEIIEIHKNKIESVGLVMNTSASCRVDPIGKLRAESVFVAPEDVYVAGKPSPHVEPVDVVEVPGGSYVLTATNKYKLIVGAKGVNIKTFGPIDMYGSIVNFTGEQINISSQNEINFDAGEKCLIRARKTTIVSKDHEPVLIESPLHISRNLITRGGSYTNGEVGLLHVTTLREFGVTSGPISNEVGGLPAAEGGMEVAVNTGTVESRTAKDITDSVAKASGDSGGADMAWLASHVHLYERIPTTFFNSAEEVRAYLNDPSNGLGATINSRNNMLAAAAVSPFTGPYSEIVKEALDTLQFDIKVDALIRVYYISGPGSGTVLPPSVPPPMISKYSIINATVLDGNFVKALIHKTYTVVSAATEKPVMVILKIMVSVPVDRVSEGDNTGGQLYEWNGGPYIPVLMPSEPVGEPCVPTAGIF